MERDPTFVHVSVLDVATAVTKGTVTVAKSSPSTSGSPKGGITTVRNSATPIRILRNMVLREGASGEDVRHLNLFLLNYEYMSRLDFERMIILNEANRFTTITTAAVRRFQESAPAVAVTGTVNAATWEAMDRRRLAADDHSCSFGISQTLEEQFFKSRGNDSIRIEISGNTINIRYRPRVFIGNLNSPDASTVFSAISAAMKLTQPFFISPFPFLSARASGVRSALSAIDSMVSSLPQAEFDWYWRRVREGILRWAGNNYRIFGLPSRVNIQVDTTDAVVRTNRLSDANVILLVNEHPLGTFGAAPVVVTPLLNFMILSRATVPNIHRAERDATNARNAASAEHREAAERNLIAVSREVTAMRNWVRRLAEHEFGHILGLFDAYDYSQTTIPFHFTTSMARIPSRAIRNDVMFSGVSQNGVNHYPQKVYSYNIAMALYAFEKNRVQNYDNGDWRMPGMVSELYFRTRTERLNTDGWYIPHEVER
jgi:hypothetical protein